MMRALDSAIGFPSRPTSASSMLGLLMPEEVRRSFMRPPGWLLQARTFYALRSVRGRDWQTTENSSAPAGSSLTASGIIPQLNVILDVVVASGERRRLGRRRLTRFPHVAPKVDLPALCRRRRPRAPSVT